MQNRNNEAMIEKRIAELQRYYNSLGLVRNDAYNLKLKDLAEKLKQRENIFKGSESWSDFVELRDLVGRKIEEYDRTGPTSILD